MQALIADRRCLSVDIMPRLVLRSTSCNNAALGRLIAGGCWDVNWQKSSMCCRSVSSPVLTAGQDQQPQRVRQGCAGGGRDVKLENIFLAEDGSVRVGDFGLTMSKMQEMAISPVGTVEYMAPEARPRPSYSP